MHLRNYLLILFLLAGCAAPPAATTTTVETLHATSLPATSLPTATSLPASPSPLPTRTPVPTASATSTPTITPTPSATLTPSPTSRPIPTYNPTFVFFQGSTIGSNVAGLGTARLLIVNHSSAAEINIIVKGVTLKRSQTAYYSATITRSAVIEILWGSYGILVQIPHHATLTTAYVQRGKDKTTLIVENDKLTIIGP